jgi:transcriptional regulator with PAS, ATPase and Fis domain
MKKQILTLLLLSITFISFSQTKAKTKAKSTKTIVNTKAETKCTAEISCSQKFGVTVTEREYLLTVIFDDKEIKFSTQEKPVEKAMNTYNITKKTEKYVVAVNKEGNYAFYNIKKKQFYYIDYYLSRYLTASYGSETTEIRKTAEKMMELLKNGSTQKDVIQDLIKQAEYDF